MAEKREEIIARNIRTFLLHSVLLLAILHSLVIAAVMSIVSWQVVLIGCILVCISTVGDLFSLGASILFRTVMLPEAIKRKNDRTAYFDEDELFARDSF